MGQDDFHLILTGANGYVGKCLVEMALAQGHRVTVLGRLADHIASHQRLKVCPWRFGEDLPEDLFSGAAGALIHVAHDWNTQTAKGEEDSDPNVLATLALANACQNNSNYRFVYASTVSARPDALNRYGRVKFAAEEKLTFPQGRAARIGLIYGGPKQGLWGTYCKLAKLPFIPMLAPWTQVQPIHLNEVCEGLLRLARHQMPLQKVYVLAGETRSFGQFLKTLSTQLYQSGLWIFPVPIELALFVATILNGLPLPLKVDPERLKGLAGLPTLEQTASLNDLGMTLLPLEQGLNTAQVTRKKLLKESVTIFQYLTGSRPTLSMMRSYVRGIEKFHGNTAISLPGLARIFPRLLRLYDHGSPNGRFALLRGRLESALSIVEASSSGAKLMQPEIKRSFLKMAVNLVVFGTIEVLIFPIRILIAKLGS